MAKKSKPKTTAVPAFEKSCGNILNCAASFFILALFLIFPLRYDNYYFNILETKTMFYERCAEGLIIVTIFIIFFYLYNDYRRFDGKHTRTHLSKLLPINWKTTFSLPDAAVLFYLFVNVLSTLQSDHISEAFWGTGGRLTGLFLNFLYVFAYFIISRFWRMKGWLLEFFLIGGILVCLLGITDYFKLDLLNFRVKINPDQASMFMSTIGNINTYTAYVAYVMGFSAGMYLEEDKLLKKIWYFSCLLISFFAIIMGESDNAYLALGALFAFTPLYLFKRKEGILRYFTLLASFFTVVLCLDFINRNFPDNVNGLEGLFQILAASKFLIILVILLWLMVAAFTFWKKKQSHSWHANTKYPFLAWCIFLATGLFWGIFSFFDVNIMGNSERYGILKGYLLFNDSWGTNRGFIWKRALHAFGDFSFPRKLLGFGPDTFGFITDTFYDEMILATGQYFDSAHNEYLQFLLTIGLLGLFFYLAFIISGVVKLYKTGSSYLYTRAMFWAIICYLFQAVVNINLPIVAPFLWLLLSCGMAACRKLS